MVVRAFAVSLVGAWLVAAAGCGRPSAASLIAAPPAVVNSSLAAVALLTANESSLAAGDSTQPAPTLTAAATEPAAPPQPQRPPADRSTTKPGDAEKITFDDLNLGMQADVVFRPFMVSDRVKDLEGKRISIVGYMHGGQAGQRGIKEFVLLKNTQCKFGPGGQADHLTDVKLKPDSHVTYTPSPVKVEGTLVLEPFQGPDGNTWSIYRLESAQIKN